jgi:hypothetical protein
LYEPPAHLKTIEVVSCQQNTLLAKKIHEHSRTELQKSENFPGYNLRPRFNRQGKQDERGQDEKGKRETGRYERKKIERERGKKGEEHKRRERGGDKRKVVQRWLGRRLCSQV